MVDRKSLLRQNGILKGKLGFRKTLFVDTNPQFEWKSTLRGLIFKNLDTVSARRFWLNGDDLDANTVTFILKVIKGTVRIEANESRGFAAQFNEGGRRFFRSRPSGVETPPGKPIPKSEGSPFARIDGSDLNFWVSSGGETLVIAGFVGPIPINRRNALPDPR